MARRPTSRCCGDGAPPAASGLDRSWAARSMRGSGSRHRDARRCGLLFSGTKLISRRWPVALARRSSVRVEGRRPPASRRAMTAWVVPCARQFRLGEARIRSGLDECGHQRELLFESVVGFGVARALAGFGKHLGCRDDAFLDGSRGSGHSTSSARSSASLISRRGVFCVFLTKTRTITIRLTAHGHVECPSDPVLALEAKLP